MKKRVLFVCVENANRSQMAEAFARMHGGEAVAGVLLAHAMFDLPLLQPGTHVRRGAAQWR